MKVILLSIVMFVSIAAQDTQELLKQKHNAAAHFFGDSLFLSGEHSFRHHKLKNGSTLHSVYKVANAFSEFWTKDDWELYHSVMVYVEGENVEVLNIYKFTHNLKTQTLQYTLFFHKQKSSVSSKVVIDRQASTFEEQYFDVILQCTTKQSAALIPDIMKCTAPGKNIVDCVLDAAFGQSANDVVSCVLANNEQLENRGVYWRIFLKPQGMGFVSAKPFGSKDECSTTTGCTHFVIPSGYKITIKATAAPGHKFEYWQYKGNLLSLDSEYSFVPSAGGDLVAHFAKE
ncbi:hypothetical protein [Candidatus Uabimicrobium amorphum]|uniref:Bacterial repeat domain-containing protein n=1 Tax=Uabimicrobium amorphum TaxID=2596890 RepID=A0A5S9F2J9_UABAM|nr:hypothetical protein [Candidatus Uabimicrobium amorphum]BBM83528.1 hypothetical protein UABAM_01880 [Candidatus Uabimicrobium amorphum]